MNYNLNIILKDIIKLICINKFIFFIFKLIIFEFEYFINLNIFNVYYKYIWIKKYY